jgi:transposase-like protein
VTIQSSKKGISAHQLWRMLGFGSYRTAWFMAHRIREGLRELFPEETGPLGGEGKTVEIDETFVGGLEKNKHRNKRKHAGTGGAGKEAVFSLVERGGRVRSHHVTEVSAKTLRPILQAHVDAATFIMTDEGGAAKKIGSEFERHGFVNHGIGEYVRGDIHINTAEGYFSVFKRGIYGTFHHVSQQHLKRYLAEFDFRYNERSALGINDKMRAAKAVKGVVGKRLTYHQPNEATHD